MRRRQQHDQRAFSLFSFQDIITSVMGIVILILLVVALELATRQLQSPAIQQAVVREDVREALELARRRLEDLRRRLAGSEWDELASMNPGDIARQKGELARLLPALEQDLARSQRSLEQLRQRQKVAEESLAARRLDEAELDRLREQLAALEEELSQLISSNTLYFRPTDTGGKVPWIVEIAADSIRTAQLGPETKPLTFAGATGDSRRRQFLAWAAERDAGREYFVLLIKPGGVRLLKEIEAELRRRRFDVGIDLIGISQTAIDPKRGAPVLVPGGGDD